MNAATGPLETALSRLEEILKAPGPTTEALAVRAGELCARLAEERFHLAVLGQFKGGRVRCRTAGTLAAARVGIWGYPGHRFSH